MLLKEIEYGSEEYQKSLELRDLVMRKPLGLSIYEEDFSHEANAVIIGAFENDELTGVGVLSVTNISMRVKVDYLCVKTTTQSKGTGKKVLNKLENIAQLKGANLVELEARVSAKGFYEKMDYVANSDVYFMDIAPVGHITMIKKL